MFKHAIFEGLKNLLRSFWLSFTAIFIITVSLFAVSLASNIWIITGFALRRLDSQLVIYADLKEDITPEARKQLDNDLRSNGDIKEVKFISREEASENLKKNVIVGKVIANLETTSKNTKNSDSLNFYTESYKLTPANNEKYAAVSSFITQSKYSAIIKSIGKLDDFQKNLEKLYYWTTIIGTICVVVFGTVSILVMINILRIAIYSRRDEIEIMRLVGATNEYIRWPFIMEGIFYNLLSAVVVGAIFLPAIYFLIPDIVKFLEVPSGNVMTMTTYLYGGFGGIVATSLIISFLSSYSATQRYLKL